MTLFEGEKKLHVFEDRKVRTTPFVGIDIEAGKLLGLGFDYYDAIRADPTKQETYFEPAPSERPADPVALYRGMKLLERLAHVGPVTLGACMVAGSRHVNTEDEHHVRKITGVIGAGDRLRILEQELPPFDDALKVLDDNSLDYTIDSLVEESDLGKARLPQRAEELMQKRIDADLIFDGLRPEYLKAIMRLNSMEKNALKAFFGFFSFKLTKLGVQYTTAANRMLEHRYQDIEQGFQRMGAPAGRIINNQVRLYATVAYQSLFGLDPRRYEDNDRFCFMVRHASLHNIALASQQLAELSKDTVDNQLCLSHDKGLYLDTEVHARRLVRTINRAIQEHMPEIYSASRLFRGDLRINGPRKRDYEAQRLRLEEMG